MHMRINIIMTYKMSQTNMGVVQLFSLLFEFYSLLGYKELEQDFSMKHYQCQAMKISSFLFFPVYFFHHLLLFPTDNKVVPVLNQQRTNQ